MRCLNMKIGDALFFIVNFIAIYSVELPQSRTSQTTTLLNEEILPKNFDKDCPNLSKLIRENNLTDNTVNCKTLNTKNLVLNEENVLKYACLIVKNILSLMCVKKLDVSSESLLRKNVSSICPFNFSHLEELGFTFNNRKFIDELEQKDHCLEVCKDLYSTKTQCIVLSNFNNYIKHVSLIPVQENSSTVEVGEPSVKSEHPEVIKQKTVSSTGTSFQDKLQHSLKSDIKDVTKEGKIETRTKTKIESKVEMPDVNLNGIKSNAKEKKTEKTVSSTPEHEPKSDKKIKIPESERKISEDENFILENNESKQKNEELNEDDEILNEDDPSLTSISEPIPMKTDFNQVPKLPKVDNPEVRMDSSIKGKEIYSGEGFFQAEDSHFFFYFIMVSSIIVVGYLAFHNKNKILAYALEGTNGRRNRRRPNPARYRKLETNLEEVISSNTTNAASSSVVY